MACNAFRATLGIGIAGVFCIVLGGILGWIVVPVVVRNQIADIVPLKKNSESWERWENPPVPIYFQIYVFHVNNPDEVVKGNLPNVTEYGPYVYRERRIKEILEVDGNRTVTYRQKLLFEFDQEASGNLTEDDTYTVANLQALALSQVMNNLKVMGSAIRLLNSAIPKMWPTGTSNHLFMEIKVKDLLFGRLPMYCNQSRSLDNLDTRVICEAVKVYSPRTIVLNDGAKGLNTFSIFRYKNNSYDGIYKIDLGIDDVTKIGGIKTWNNMTMLSDWKADACNQILGTDSTIFRPYLALDDVDSLYIFNTDACRSIKLTRGKYSEYKGVVGLRYETDENTFASVLDNPDNYCYCPQSIKGTTHFGGCLRSGVVELSSCHRVPIVISHPHFLMADPFYQKIEGLKPDKDKHQAFLNLEPYTGYPLSGASRIQINIFLQSIKEVTVMKNLPNVLLPVVWMEEKIDLTDNLIEEINTKLLSNLLMVDVIRWTMVGAGILFIFFSVIYYYAKVRPALVKTRMELIKSDE